MRASESTPTGTGPSRELASRESDGVHVHLLWHPEEDAVTVSVEDSRAGRCFEVALSVTVLSTPSTTRSPTPRSGHGPGVAVGETGPRETASAARRYDVRAAGTR
jgi:hypothetical protein